MCEVIAFPLTSRNLHHGILARLLRTGPAKREAYLAKMLDQRRQELARKGIDPIDANAQVRALEVQVRLAMAARPMPDRAFIPEALDDEEDGAA